MDNDDKLIDLLTVVIDNYISKWEPIGSKFLHSLELVEYAPSTLRKYLNLLEKAWFVYQPYNSSWRIPTLDGLAVYLDSYMATKKTEKPQKEDSFTLDVDMARGNLRWIIESVWKVVDGVVVWFLRNDEYYFLGINNLLREHASVESFSTTKYIIEFIESRQVIWFLSTKIIKSWQVYYTFVKDWEMTLSCLYAKVNVNKFDWIISIVWPMRMNYKKNLSVLQKLLDLVG